MVETGTATSYTDLLAKLRTFVTSTLSAPEQWTEERYAGGELILQGPGSGSDTIYVGIKTVADAVGDYQNWKLAGMTGYLGAQTFENQPGYSGDAPSPIHMPLWDSTIPYWFVANGRRIIVVAKVSTRYMYCYLGFLNSYASPGQYPYPLVVGGSLAWGSVTPPAPTSASWRWSYAGTEMANPAHAIWNSPFEPIGGYVGRGQLRIRNAAGVWRDLWAGWGSNYSPNTLTPIDDKHYHSNGDIATWRLIPDQAALIGGIWPPITQLDAMDPTLDGDYVVLPIVLMAGVQSGDGPDLYGELDGVFQVTGGPAAEDVVQIGGDDYLMVPNVFRTTRQDFIAVKLV